MLFGICVGCAVQLAIIILLLALALSWAGVIRLPLAVIGCAYLLWLSWKLFQAASPDAKEQAQPMSLLSGALFQAVNPKARLMVINVAILFTPREGATFVHTLSIIAGFALLNLPCVLLWAVLGDRLRNALRVTETARLQRRDVRADGRHRAVVAVRRMARGLCLAAAERRESGRLFGADAGDQVGNGQHHGGAHHLLITLALHGDQRFIRLARLQEGRHRRQRGHAVQLAERPEDFVVDEAVFRTVVVQLFAHRHQQLGVFIFVAGDHPSPYISFRRTDRSPAGRCRTIAVRRHISPRSRPCGIPAPPAR